MSIAAKDTIAAIASPHGNASGAVAIVRISGPLVPKLMLKICQKSLKARHAELCTFHASDARVLDFGLALFFPGPNSFTGEDVLELQGHGGIAVSSGLLAEVLNFGVRLAEPGEFAFRAFQNAKLDLSQAEAIADLIAAQSAEAVSAALKSLQGAFAKEVNSLIEALIHLRMHFEFNLDFPEESPDDLEFIAKLQVLHNNLQTLLIEAKNTEILNSGLKMVILGEPNVGKSSILNVLAGSERAIVTEIPGTTRDLISHKIKLAGIIIEIIDTAGIRISQDRVEQEGIKRSWQALAEADLVLYVLDNRESLVLNPAWLEAIPKSAKLILVVNKIDLSQDSPLYTKHLGYPLVKLTAKSNLGFKELEQAILESLELGDRAESRFVARKRHIQALELALAELVLALNLSQSMINLELIAEHLRLAQNALEAISGRFSADDLLGRIFAEFCIGK